MWCRNLTRFIQAAVAKNFVKLKYSCISKAFFVCVKNLWNSISRIFSSPLVNRGIVWHTWQKIVIFLQFFYDLLVFFLNSSRIDAITVQCAMIVCLKWTTIVLGLIIALDFIIRNFSFCFLDMHFFIVCISFYQLSSILCNIGQRVLWTFQMESKYSQKFRFKLSIYNIFVTYFQKPHVIFTSFKTFQVPCIIFIFCQRNVRNQFVILIWISHLFDLSKSYYIRSISSAHFSSWRFESKRVFSGKH